MKKEEHSAEARKDYGRAEKLARQTIAESEKYGSDDLRLADSYAVLGDLLYNHTDRLEDAQSAYKSANAIYQKKFGPTGPKSIYMISQLYQIMDKLGDREKLKKKQARQQAIRERLRLRNAQTAPAPAGTTSNTTAAQPGTRQDNKHP